MVPPLRQDRVSEFIDTLIGLFYCGYSHVYCLCYFLEGLFVSRQLRHDVNSNTSNCLRMLSLDYLELGDLLSCGFGGCLHVHWQV